MGINSSLNTIYQVITDNQLSSDSREQLSEEFAYLAEKMNMIPEESIVLAFMLGTPYAGKNLISMTDYIGCSQIEILNWQKHLDSLVSKRILYKKCQEEEEETEDEDHEYGVCMEVITSFADDSFTPVQAAECGNDDELFSLIRKVFKRKRKYHSSQKMMMEDLERILHSNPQSHFVQEYKQTGLTQCPPIEQIFFFYVCHRYVNFGMTMIDSRYITDFAAGNEDELTRWRQLKTGELDSVKNGLLKISADDEKTGTIFAQLSEDIKQKLFAAMNLNIPQISEVEEKKAEDSLPDLIASKGIQKKEMFYNETEKKQVEHLGKLLQQEHFKAIQTRLDKRGMRKGFNVILYGEPGTGKTETILQLARQTGRDIVIIDASKIKSKWIGSSEKNIKKTFDQYKELAKTQAITPILFFNEADAIFGKRIQDVDSSTDQTINTIQNIILQEMETLEGIMICTTNMEENLDEAFERRFLYKIKLKLPEAETRCRIWESMLPDLDQEEAKELADTYAFSGGNIENISRKTTVDYILNGTDVSFKAIQEFCEEEKFAARRQVVGF